MSNNLNTASQMGANGKLPAEDYMQTVTAEWIIYSMCLLAITWAIVQTVMLGRMNMDPSKIKSQYGGVQHY